MLIMLLIDLEMRTLIIIFYLLMADWIVFLKAQYTPLFFRVHAIDSEILFFVSLFYKYNHKQNRNSTRNHSSDGIQDGGGSRVEHTFWPWFW